MKHAQNITKQDRSELLSFGGSSTSLTFAVIWDPVNGLEAFSSGPLFDGTTDLAGVNPVSERYSIKSDFEDFDEPFAVFGSRQLHFIDIRSSKLYERCVAGDFDNIPPRPNSQCTSSASFYSTDEPIPLVNLKDAPNSYFNPPRRSTCHPSDNDQSSLLEWEESILACDGHSHFIAKVKQHGIDDEGFFEASSHADCDPHLPSRFSTSTASTAAFLALRTRPTPIIDRIARRPAVIVAASDSDRTSKKARVTDRIVSFTDKGLRYSSCLRPGSIRLSRVFRGPWFKRSVNEDDGKWVLVEVQSIVIDRIVDD